jgi:hypothetical protein
MAWPYLTTPFGHCFRHFYLFNFATAKMVKKKFIQRRYVRKVVRSSFARPLRAVIMVTSLSGGSSSSASLLLESLSLGVCGALVEKEVPPTKRSRPVPSSREVEDLVAAPTINPVSAPLVGANLTVLSSGSEDEVDWEALIAEDEVN